MGSFKVGSRVKAVEKEFHPKRKTMTGKEVVGTVVEVLDAREAYPERPQYSTRYKLRHANDEGKFQDYKYGEGESIYRVQVDGERQVAGRDEKGDPVPRCRNFHERQLTDAS